MVFVQMLAVGERNVAVRFFTGEHLLKSGKVEKWKSGKVEKWKSGN